MRRYFDEYRGLRETTGHVEPAPALHTSRAQVRADARHMRASRLSGPQAPARGRLRSLRHHAGRAVFAALGLARRPAAARVCGGACRSRGATARPRRSAAARATIPYACGAAATSPSPPRRLPLRRPSTTSARSLHFAWIVPPVPARQRRPHDALHDRARARARGSLVLDLDPRPRGPDARPRGRRPPGADRALRAAARRCVQRLRGLARRGRRVRHRLADRLSAVDAARTAS